MGTGEPVDIYSEYARTHDPRLREAIVDLHAGLARRLAGRFAHRGEEPDDLVQVAFGGLLKAIDRFDPELGVHFRDERRNLHVPRTVQENYLRVRGR